jgi:mannose-6-phosphate isomerase-like protein (cupin superfamily)
MTRAPVILPMRKGRGYAMPGMTAVFKADGAETNDAYCVSEWWLEPRADGPGPHSHEANDEIFVVLAGTMSILVGDRWVEAEAGKTVIIPAGITHDFRNRTDAEAGLFNAFVPGGFETNMPSIVQWFEDNPRV